MTRVKYTNSSPEIKTSNHQILVTFTNNIANNFEFTARPVLYFFLAPITSVCSLANIKYKKNELKNMFELCGQLVSQNKNKSNNDSSLEELFYARKRKLYHLMGESYTDDNCRSLPRDEPLS